MLYCILVFVIFILLFLLLALSAYMGRRFGRSQLSHHAEHKLEVIGVAESAVLALLGLLIAFTFSGAYDRYESRKLHILEEANAFDTAYEYADLVLPKYQEPLRAAIRQYLDLHLTTYHDIPSFARVNTDLYKSIAVQHKIWSIVVAASEENANNNLTQLVIPSISRMFDVAHTGVNMTKIHPPWIIFILLIGLSALGAFLVGYNSADIKQKYPIHIISYVFLTAFTVYIIMNIEFPRVGFVRLNAFDQMLKDVREDMNAKY